MKKNLVDIPLSNIPEVELGLKFIILRELTTGPMCWGYEDTGYTYQSCPVWPGHDFRPSSQVCNAFSSLRRFCVNFCISFMTTHFISYGILSRYLTCHKNKYSNHDWMVNIFTGMFHNQEILDSLCSVCSSLKIWDFFKYLLPHVKWQVWAILIDLLLLLLLWLTFRDSQASLKQYIFKFLDGYMNETK